MVWARQGPGPPWPRKQEGQGRWQPEARSLAGCGSGGSFLRAPSAHRMPTARTGGGCSEQGVAHLGSPAREEMPGWGQNPSATVLISRKGGGR